MGESTQRDRLLASLACVILAGMLGGLAFWAWTGVGHAGRDHERFAHNWRAQGDIQGFALYLIALAGLLSLGAVGLLGLAAWILIPERIRAKCGCARRSRRAAR